MSQVAPLSFSMPFGYAVPAASQQASPPQYPTRPGDRVIRRAAEGSADARRFVENSGLAFQGTRPASGRNLWARVIGVLVVGGALSAGTLYLLYRYLASARSKRNSSAGRSTRPNVLPNASLATKPKSADAMTVERRVAPEPRPVQGGAAYGSDVEGARQAVSSNKSPSRSSDAQACKQAFPASSTMRARVEPSELQSSDVDHSPFPTEVESSAAGDSELGSSLQGVDAEPHDFATESAMELDELQPPQPGAEAAASRAHVGADRRREADPPVGNVVVDELNRMARAADGEAVPPHAQMPTPVDDPPEIVSCTQPEDGRPRFRPRQGFYRHSLSGAHEADIAIRESLHLDEEEVRLYRRLHAVLSDPAVQGMNRDNAIRAVAWALRGLDAIVLDRPEISGRTPPGYLATAYARHQVDPVSLTLAEHRVFHEMDDSDVGGYGALHFRIRKMLNLHNDKINIYKQGSQKPSDPDILARSLQVPLRIAQQIADAARSLESLTEAWFGRGMRSSRGGLQRPEFSHTGFSEQDEHWTEHPSR